MNRDGHRCSKFAHAARRSSIYFSESERIAMDLAHIRPYTHKHCRFKLRSGKEVFGVIWEVETAEDRAEFDGDPARGDMRRLFFASVRDYERLRAEASAVHVIAMQPEEIVAVESLAS
jgi:hypothetical protein